MSFEPTSRVRDLLQRLQEFMDQYIYESLGF
jgi:hypothetical protein